MRPPLAAPGLLVATLWLTVGPSVGGPADDAARALQGRWTVASLETDGKKAEAKKVASWVLIVEGKEMTARDGLDILSAYTFRLTPPVKKGEPGTIDLVVTVGDDRDRKVAGIYTLVGDTFAVCVAEPDKERPKAFTTGGGGTGHMHFVFQRAKKE